MGWLSQRKTREHDLERELKAHLELEAEEQEQAGISKEEARWAARRALGKVASVQEGTREAWGWGWMERFIQDVLYGLRSFRKTPTFTVVIVLTLALGIGATSAIFSILNAALLQPLPYKNSDRLVMIEVHPAHNPGVHSLDTYQDFQAWKNRSHTFEQLAAATFVRGGRIFSGAGAAREVLAMPVSKGFFPLLGVSPELGRAFQKDDLQRGCTVVLRNQFWKTAFGGNRDAVGKTFELNDESCTVAGVMPPGFTFYPDVVTMWRLITPADEIARDAANSMVFVVGRLKTAFPSRARKGNSARSMPAHTSTTSNSACRFP